MNFYQSVLLKKKFLENISKKVRLRDNYPLLFTLSDQIYDSHSKYCFYICHKSVELQNKSKIF